MEIEKGLKLSDVSFWVDNVATKKKQKIIDRCSLHIQPGEFVSFHGKSGCGKTTLMNLISGLIAPSSGKIFLDGKEVLSPSKEIAFVFQESALYPYLTIRQNIELGMRLNGISAEDRKKRADELLCKVGLSEHAHKYPVRDKLSGGMKQRAEIASVLADESKVIIMDEPFGALDDQTREEMQLLILQVWRDFQKIILFITHNKTEALLLSDKVVLMPSRNGDSYREVSIDLPRPRNDLQSEFMEYRKKLHDHLK